MQDRLQEIFDSLNALGNQPMSEIGMAPFLVTLLISLAASIFIAYLYLYFYSSRATGSHVQRSFPLLGVSITAIFICIQFSLPLSLGLLGALSIVRFRTPVKEPEEIGFIMLVIAASLASATLNFGFLLLIVAVAILALLVRQWAPAVIEGTSHDGSVVITMPEPAFREHGSDLMDLLQDRLRRARVETVSTNDQQVVLSIVFHGSASRDLLAIESDVRDLAAPTDFTILFNRPGRL